MSSARPATKIKRRTFKRLVNILDDQKTVCDLATECIYKLDQIGNEMILRAQGSNQGQIDKILEIDKKLDEIKLLIDSGI